MPQYTFYRLKDALEPQALAAVRFPVFKPLTDENPTAARSCGWLLTGGNAQVTFRGIHRLRFAEDRKQVPASVLERALDARVRELESRGSPVGRSQKKDLRDELNLSLLPRAFPVRKVTPVYLWPDGLIAIGSTSSSQVDSVLAAILAALPPNAALLPIIARQASERLAEVLRSPDEWLPAGAELGDFAQMVGLPRDGTGAKQVVACRGADLGSSAVQEHLRWLPQVQALRIVAQAEPLPYAEPDTSPLVSCVIDRELRLKQVKWLSAQPANPSDPELDDIRDADRVARALLPLLQLLGSRHDEATEARAA